MPRLLSLLVGAGLVVQLSAKRVHSVPAPLSEVERARSPRKEHKVEHSPAVIVSTEPSPTLLLHVGPWRTGSTAFQLDMSSCAEMGMYEGWPVINGSSLTPKALWDYAHSLHVGHDRMGYSKQANLTRKIDSLLRDNPRQVVLSSEVFSAFNASERAHLARVTSNMNVTVAFVYRNAVSLMLSLYQHATRTQGPVQTFDEWLSAADRWDTNQLDALGVIAGYVETFGRGRVKVLNEDGLKHEGLDLTNALLETAGLEPLPQECRTEGKPGHSEGVDDLLLWRAFLQHVKRTYGCDLDKQNVAETDLTYLRQFDVPRRCSDQKALLKRARARDAALRRDYADLIVHGSKTASRDAMVADLPYCQLDIENVTSDPTWQKRMRSQYMVLQHLCS